LKATVTVVTQQVVDGLKQRMADLNVRGTMAPGHLVFSVIDFLQHARTDTPTSADAISLFHYLENHHKEDVRGHVLMISTPRDNNSTYHSPTMTIRSLQRLLCLLGDKVDPDFRRIFEGIIAGIA
jgi:hypothetical protein